MAVKKDSGSGPTVSFDVEVIRLQMVALMRNLGQKASFETLRPLHVFLGISAPTMCLAANAFSPPVQHIDKSLVEKILARLNFNFGYFLTNYMVVAAGIAVVISLLHPGMLLVCGMMWGLWWLHEYMIHNEIIVFGRNIGTLLPITQRSSILTVVTLVSIIWKCLFPFLSFLAVSGFVIMLHALLRDPKNLRHGPCDENDDEEQVMVERGDVI